MDGCLDRRARRDGLVITRSPDSHRSAATEPRDILRIRFARGEINQTEYEQACRVLDPEKEPRK
jgi:uncharacterized membrane protein